ncbi:alpha-amylase family protein [Falsirhodobacter xinxiangensis]|uniref:alpha-amylase family protein n=1 Tax=Falsirhodobacter xinxiangensis TaxID=2530049 RepID=UPI0010AA5B5B|nr:alpha-amylase family protein [Rhodobacter xinxiangensis]
MDMERTGDAWWKNAVFYCLDVETFQDSNDDGVGDFRGLTHRIDYLAGLGVTCIWLMPFYPSDDRDDGYDITDYYAVDPRLGTLGDFVEFMRTARDRGIRVIADLVVNHTSRAHPWFQSARTDPRSPHRDWYVWRSDPPEETPPSDLVFPDQESSIWEWDDVAAQYYLHRFYKHQPDLNIASPALREEIRRIIGFWMELGLSGFRVDAVPFLLETEGIGHPLGFDPHDWLRDLRGFLNRRRGDGVLLGEVNLSYEQTRAFMGDDGGDELHMCLDFNMNQSVGLSLVREDAGSILHTLAAMPSLAHDNAWGQFVRNHDEWSLDKLTEAERREVFRAFGPRKDMQLYGRGLRRRMPSMLQDEARLRMVYSLAFSLPGAPVLFYGEEIGMAENLAIPGRLSVRAPMQWNAGRNGGFSGASSDVIRRPVVATKAFAPPAVNANDQDREPASLLNWMTRLIRRRRESPEIGFGTCRALKVAEAAIVALRHDWGPSSLLTMHNLSAEACTVSIPLSEVPNGGELVPLLGDAKITRGSEGVEVLLPPYGLLWGRISASE